MVKHATTLKVCCFLLYQIRRIDAAVHDRQRWSPPGRSWPRRRPRGHILKSLGFGLEGQVLGLDFEASSPQKFACPRHKDRANFCIVEIILENARNLAKKLQKPFFPQLQIARKKFLINFFFWRTLEPVSFVLGLEHFCPWPREGLFSEGLFYNSDFFLCSWPLPRVFCPRLHLWWSATSIPKISSKVKKFWKRQ